ncbi:MAG: hypothetical protein M3O46_14380 [Myxococcota bacterium]|nr:hypothetical protein [Myxococcota bacterium]
MPQHYRQAFDVVAAGEHASIVDRRAEAPVHAEVWRRLPNGGVVICVVADDRPGLLSLISASLAVEKMDVTAAQAYTRAVRAGGKREAVDFLWLRSGGGSAAPIADNDASTVAGILHGLVTGQVALESVLRRVRPRPSSPPPGAPRVTFAKTLDGSQAVLTIATSDRPGLLLGITLALFRTGVQIIASEATTKNGGVTDRFTIAEQDGSPLSPERCSAVEAGVVAAIESLGRAPQAGA